jgi:hypothetical protein
MTEQSLDDRLKQAQIDKVAAETRKLGQETDALRKGRVVEAWSDAIKVVGAVILGAGGIVAAVTQFEVGELKAQTAKAEQGQAEKKKAEAEAKAASAVAEQAKAEAAASSAVAMRDAALRDQRDAEATTKEYRAALTQKNSDLRSARPGEATPRLTYVQFKGDFSRSQIDELRRDLATRHFNAPGAERVDSIRYGNLVKYFKESERKDAEELASAVDSFFAEKKCPLKMKVVSAAGTTTVQNPPLEIWLASCSS